MSLLRDRIDTISDEALYTVTVVSGGHFLSHFYLMSLPPLFPLLVADFDTTNAQLGLLISMIYLSTFLFQIPVGELVDRIGAKQVFVLGVALSAAGIMSIGLATSYRYLLLFALVAGVGQAAFHPADYALLDAVTDAGMEGKSFGVHTFAGFVGFAAAPPIVGTLGLVWGWQVALLATGAVGLLYAGFVQLTMDTVYLDSTRQTRNATADSDGGTAFESLSLLRRPPVVAMFAFFVVVTMADIGIQTFTVVLAVSGFGFGEAAGNAILTAFLATTAIGVLVGGELADRYDIYWIIVLSLAVAAVMAAASVSPLAAYGRSGALFVWTTMGFAFGLALPARDRVVNMLSGDGNTGKSFGIVYTGLPLGGFVGPAILGAVIDEIGILTGFGLNAVFFGAAAVIVLVFKVNFGPAMLPDEELRDSA